MLREHRYKNLIWVNLENPTRNEAIQVMEEFNLTPSVAEQFLRNVPHSKIESYGNFQFLVLRFPTRSKEGNAIEHEVDFVVGRDFLITVHHGPSSAILESEKTFETMAILDTIREEDKSGLLLLFIIEKIYAHISDELNEIGDSLVRIENRIFEGGSEEKMIRNLSLVNRRIIDMQRSMHFHSNILIKLEALASRSHITSLSNAKHTRDEYEQIIQRVASHKDILKDLRDTAELLLSTRSNQVMRLITIIGFTLLPFTMIASILGSGMPLPFEITSDLVIMVFGATFLVALSALLYFRRNHLV